MSTQNREFPGIRASTNGSSFQWVVWGVVGTVALVVRLHALDRFSYWLDEMLEVFTIRSGWGNMLRSLHEQVLNPPLDYVVQKAFDVLGPSDAARRILPALWGTAFVVILGLLVARRANTRVGLVTGLCLAFAPYHVHHSQEVRPYSLGLCLVALTLLLTDRYLERPSGLRLVAFLIGAIATAYTLFLAALVLLLAGGTLILDDAFTGSASRQRTARQLVRWSPALLLAIAVACLPWLSRVWKSLGAPPMTTPPVFGIKRVARLFSVFGFGYHDWYPLGWPGVLFILLVVGGAVLALTEYRLRFLFVWAAFGCAATEILEERHGVFDSIFHFLPAGIALTALATLPIGWLAERRSRAWLVPIPLFIVLYLDARALSFYFRHGRVDWRPVGAFLRAQPINVPILAAGAYTQLSLGYYVNGPDWLCCPTPAQHKIIDVGYDASGLVNAWKPSQRAWLVTPVGATLVHDALLHDIPGTTFPTAEMGVVVRNLGYTTETAKP